MGSRPLAPEEGSSCPRPSSPRPLTRIEVPRPRVDRRA